MPKSMRVKTRFEADENVSAVARRIEKNTRRMNNSIHDGFRKSTKSAMGFSSVLKGVLAAGIVQKGFGLLAQGVTEVATQFIGFDDAITAAAVRFKDIGPDAKDFDAQLKKIKISAREAGAATVFTAEQNAKALDFLARAGFTSEEAMGSLRSMINLSIATGEDFARVADISSDLLGAFGLAVDDPIKKIQNLNRLNDVLVKTANSANVTVEDMFETMKDIGPIAAGILNVSLEEVAAQTAILGNSGIKGTNAMTALKNAYLNLASPAGAGADIMKIFNLTLKDGKGGVRSLTDVLKELNEKMKLKGLDPVDQARVMDAIFGKRAIAGAKNLQGNIDQVDDFKKMLDGAKVTAQKTADVMQTSLGSRIKGLGSALTEIGFKFIDPFEKNIKSAIVSATNFFREINPAPLIASIKTIVAVYGKWLGMISKTETYSQLKATFGALGESLTTVFGLIGQITDAFMGADTAKGITALDVALFPLRATLKMIELSLKAITATIKLFQGDNLKKALTTEKGENLGQIARRGGLSAVAETLFGGGKSDEEKRKDAEQRILQFGSLQPNLNVNVQNNINAKNVEVDTTIKAPGTKGLAGANAF